MKPAIAIATAILLAGSVALCANAPLPPPVQAVVERTCAACHSGDASAGNFDLTALAFELGDPANRERWVHAHDMVEQGEMPPEGVEFSRQNRQAFVESLGTVIRGSYEKEIAVQGRGPMRRLNREEYEQNLRDLLHLPHLDIRDILPADRESHQFSKSSDSLDISRVYLTACLDAAAAALNESMVTSEHPPVVTNYRAVGKRLSAQSKSTGERKAMFYARDSKAVDLQDGKEGLSGVDGGRGQDADPMLELALFRSPGWPYSVFPFRSQVASAGQYRVRFSARAVVQIEGLEIQPAKRAVPMTFRSRRPSDHNIAEDVRHTGGIIDIAPEPSVYETTVLLGAGQTIEYELLGLPVPQIDAGGVTGRYRFPPFPPGGQPGVAFQWLEMEGPIQVSGQSSNWPPPSHRVLFDDVGASLRSFRPEKDARRLLARFIRLAAREPVPREAIAGFDRLVSSRLRNGEPLGESLLTGYKAFLCSDLFLYLREPTREDDHLAIANRLSHFLAGTRPDRTLQRLAEKKKLRDALVLLRETDRLIDGDGFGRFVKSFTDQWLSLRDLRRDDPDIRLYPEYRLDHYLVQSMGRETRAFVKAIIRENLTATALVDADFTYANDRLARHYGLPHVPGSALRKVPLPADSPYGGLLTQGAILKVTSNGSTTSPVVRGAWIMDRLVGRPAPPPPPGVPSVEPDIRGAKTIREQLGMHTTSTECAACHAKFDPVGLALENFDIMGRWRTRYRGLETGGRITGIDRAGHDFSYTLGAAVDASGELADGRSFRDIHELKGILASNPRHLARNLLQRFTVYSTGTPVNFADRREIESILDRCASDGYRVRDLIRSLVQSKIFLGPSGCS